ncbi:MAG: SAM-dependent DNA methyltransferase, partial [Anaerolineae bacterium]|nr:SAM-dependent DNA methyltransferase [Anaerolineae bacterium]
MQSNGVGAENEQAGWNGGFDVVLGNPPWERLNLEDRQFFATTRPDIVQAPTSRRKAMIEALAEQDSSLFFAYREAQRKAAADISIAHNSGLYLHLNQARLNTYSLFVELNANICGRNGRCGIIVPSGVATDDTSRLLFRFLVDSRRLISLYDFDNRKSLFPEIDSRMKFCLLTLAGSELQAKVADFVFFASDIQDLADQQKHFQLSRGELDLLSPITGLCPTFRTKRDQRIVVQIYQRISPFIIQKKEKKNWINSDFLIMFRSDSSSHLYTSPAKLNIEYPRSPDLQHLLHDQIGYLPVWESKLLHQFDHRFATFEGVQQSEREAGNAREVKIEEKDKIWSAQPRNWVIGNEIGAMLAGRNWSKNWLIGYRDITNSTNERTAIASLLPLGGASQPLNVFLPDSAVHGAFWLAGMNSFVVDYVVRQSIGGVHLNITTCRQLPILPPIKHPLADLVIACVCELTYTSPSVRDFAHQLGYTGEPFRWDEARRFLLRAELDAAYFHLYGIAREDVDYILDTFPIVRRKDEAQHGEYRTKRVILEI